MDLLDRQLAQLPQEGRVLYAVLDWGLGHATRSSVLVGRLLDQGRSVTIAADGLALTYLREAFPECTFLVLPSYDISYTRSAALLPFHLAWQAPKVLKTIRTEHQVIADYIKKHPVAAIISDNRYGCYHPSTTSILLTHQLQLYVKGCSGWLANQVLTRWLSRFDAVWVPDDPQVNLSGQLSHHASISPASIGVLSTMRQVESPYSSDILIALSGPEPQRTLLEDALVHCLAETDYSVMMVRGTTLDRPVDLPSSWRVIDLADADQMSAAFAAAKLVICRSGYSTIMDLHHLGKQAILVPTPGQPEQEYLAEWLRRKRPSQFAMLDQERVKDELRGVVASVLTGRKL